MKALLLVRNTYLLVRHWISWLLAIEEQVAPFLVIHELVLCVGHRIFSLARPKRTIYNSTQLQSSQEILEV